MSVGDPVTSPLPHRFDSEDRLEAAQKNGLGDVDRSHDHVHAVMQPVDEVDVHSSARAEHGLVARGAAPTGGMCGQVGRPPVGLDLDDASGRDTAVDTALDDGSEQVSCDVENGTTEEGGRGGTSEFRRPDEGTQC